ncbi:restriction endonuclease subunit S [Nannocystis pusilla]|uniref:restriction endonuclease subunit S n=1 Tax=Nannocystis pusilla TaxID=889268 RepID=UPI003DA537D9
MAIDSFPSVPLESLCDPQRGITYGIVKVGEFQADGIPVIRGGDIREGRIVWDDAKRVSREVSEQFRRTILRGGEIVINLISEPGHCAIVPPDLAGANVSRDVGVIPVRTDVSREYIDYFLKSPLCVKWFEARLQGSVTQKINLSTLKSVPVPLPPHAQQRRIAGVLRALDDKIELNRQTNETLEAMARAQFKSWFVDFDPVQTDAGSPSAVTAMLESPIGEIPVGWRVAPLGDLLSVLETGGRPKGGVRGITAGVVSVGAESIVGIGRFDFSKTKFVPQEFYDSMTKGRVADRDVLLYKDGGRPGEFEPHVSMFGSGFPFSQFCINEHVYRLRAAPPLTQVYLYFALESERLKDEMRVKGTGVAIPGLNSSAVRSLTFLIPPAAIIDCFDRLVGPWVSQMLLNAAESKTLADIRDQLLPRLLSGELRVRDAEGLVEATV